MYHQFAQIQYGADHGLGEEYKLKGSEKGREGQDQDVSLLEHHEQL